MQVRWFGLKIKAYMFDWTALGALLQNKKFYWIGLARLVYAN